MQYKNAAMRIKGRGVRGLKFVVKNISNDYQITNYDYDLPEEMIAQEPAAQRDESRLMICERESGSVSHTTFSAITEHLNAGDLLVFNNTRVMKARVRCRRRTGGKVELLFLHPLKNGWRAIGKPFARLKSGETIVTENGCSIEITEKHVGGNLTVQVPDMDAVELMECEGCTPLPPYIKRDSKEFDCSRYQTVYAAEHGSAAAPTAGLHFTEALIRRLSEAGVETCYTTLHVGIGTFKPVQSEDIRNHRMHAEFYRITEKAAAQIQRALKEKRRIVAVGTTSMRVLESACSGSDVAAGKGWTDLYITPDYTFKAVSALITNFHLPRTSLLILVSAFAGRKFILDCYQQAIEQGYRFYSYGDAMFVS